MAYKPSDRRQSAVEKADLDIRPIMNLMVCLIPLLLAGAQFIKNTQLEVNLPPGKSASDSDSEPPADEDKKKLNLGLTVAITAKGFYISASNVTIYGPAAPEEPTVPLTAEGEYDYLALRNRLKDLRKEIDSSGKNFADKDKIKLTASKEIAYGIYIKVQDAVSAEIVDKKPVEIFHLVQIGQVI